jgi:hypothetical protein
MEEHRKQVCHCRAEVKTPIKNTNNAVIYVYRVVKLTLFAAQLKRIEAK